MKNSIFIHIYLNFPSKTTTFAHHFDTRDKQGSKENHLQNEISILPQARLLYNFYTVLLLH